MVAHFKLFYFLPAIDLSQKTHFKNLICPCMPYMVNLYFFALNHLRHIRTYKFDIVKYFYASMWFKIGIKIEIVIPCIALFLAEIFQWCKVQIFFT